MNATVRPLAAFDASGTLIRWLRFVLDCWRQITLKQVLVVNLIALFIDVWFVLTWLRENLQAHSWQVLAWAVGENAMIATGLLLVVAVADRVVPTRWPWWMPYAIGALLGALVVNLTTTWCFEYLIPLRTLMDYTLDPAAVHRKRTVIEVTDGVVIGGVAIFVYAWLRRLRLQQARLHAVQQEQVTTRRRLAEARLRTMQARIEPEFLIDTLVRIEWLQGIDTDRALRALDALNVYLRATMPQDANAESTLRGELVLTRAWLDVLRGSSGNAIRLETALPHGTEATTFPAMILPCVIKHEASRTGVTMIRVEAELMESCLRLRVYGIATDSSVRDDDRIESLRVRLTTLYGDRARFLRQRSVQGDRYCTETIIEIPR